MARGCGLLPSPALGLTAPIMFAIFVSRIYFFPAALLKRRRTEWAMLCHYASIVTVFFWIVSECIAVVSFCKLSCTMNIAAWATANTSQHFFYFTKWKIVDSKLSSDSKLILLIGILVITNALVMLNVVMTAALPEFATKESVCNFDPITMKKIAVFCVIDTLVGIIFLGIFLRPLLASRRAMVTQQIETTPAALSNVIRCNVAGALLSQFAQTSTLVLALVASDTWRLHCIRVTTCLNLIGLSVMLRDPFRVRVALRRQLSTAAAACVIRHRRVYVIHHHADGGAKAGRQGIIIADGPKNGGRKPLRSCSPPSISVPFSPPSWGEEKQQEKVKFTTNWAANASYYPKKKTSTVMFAANEADASPAVLWEKRRSGGCSSCISTRALPPVAQKKNSIGSNSNNNSNNKSSNMLHRNGGENQSSSRENEARVTRRWVATIDDYC